MALALNIGKCTLLGNYRENNEDAIDVKQFPDMTVAIVADGMGGQQAGEIASKQAVEVLPRELKKNLASVPSGALTALPFHLLVTEKPPAPLNDGKNAGPYRDAAWLLRRHAVTAIGLISAKQSVSHSPWPSIEKPMKAGPAHHSNTRA